MTIFSPSLSKLSVDKPLVSAIIIQEEFGLKKLIKIEIWMIYMLYLSFNLNNVGMMTIFFVSNT